MFHVYSLYRIIYFYYASYYILLSVSIEKFILFSLNKFSVDEKVLGMENEFFMRKHGSGHDRVRFFPLSSASVP